MAVVPTIPEREYLTRETLAARRPAGAPEFLCPGCGWVLHFEGSRPTEGELRGGLSDFYVCPGGCGTFEHVRATHRAHIVE